MTVKLLQALVLQPRSSSPPPSQLGPPAIQYLSLGRFLVSVSQTDTCGHGRAWGTPRRCTCRADRESLARCSFRRRRRTKCEGKGNAEDLKDRDDSEERRGYNPSMTRTSQLPVRTRASLAEYVSYSVIWRPVLVLIARSSQPQRGLVQATTCACPHTRDAAQEPSPHSMYPRTACSRDGPGAHEAKYTKFSRC